MTASEEIDALVTRERQLMACQDHWQSVLTRIIARLGADIDAVQTERWALQEQGFRDFEHEHDMQEAA